MGQGRCASVNHEGRRFVKARTAVWWVCTLCERQFCSDCEGSDDAHAGFCDRCWKAQQHDPADDPTDQELDDRIFERERAQERTR